MITRELTDLDFTQPIVMKHYDYRRGQPIYKMHFNVVPCEMPTTFRLATEI